MRCCANEALGIGAVAHHDLVYDILQPPTARSENGDDRDVILKALFDKGVEKALVGNGRMQQYLASECHTATLPARMSAFHPLLTQGEAEEPWRLSCQLPIPSQNDRKRCGWQVTYSLWSVQKR